jgi:hypothetical protein
MFEWSSSQGTNFREQLKKIPLVTTVFDKLSHHPETMMQWFSHTLRFGRRAKSPRTYCPQADDGK